ncbi:unnamed protein product [Prunus armeniaca]
MAAGRRRTKPANFLSKPELFSSFSAKPRRLATGPGRGRKRTAARSFWYRPRQLWWPDESTAGQNVAGCSNRRARGERDAPEERERVSERRGQFRLLTKIPLHNIYDFATEGI